MKFIKNFFRKFEKVVFRSDPDPQPHYQVPAPVVDQHKKEVLVQAYAIVKEACETKCAGKVGIDFEACCNE